MCDGNSHGFLWYLVVSSAAVFWLVSAGMPVCAQGEVSPDAPKIEQAIKQLGADAYADREAAFNQLLDIGPPAVDALKKAGTSRDPEVSLQAREAVQLIGLGVKSSTPAGVREVALRMAREEDEAAVAKTAEELLQKGEPGRQIAVHVVWCASQKDGQSQKASVLARCVNPGRLTELILKGNLSEAEFILWMQAAADPAQVDHLAAFHLIQGTLPKALAEAQGY